MKREHEEELDVMRAELADDIRRFWIELEMARAEGNRVWSDDRRGSIGEYARRIRALDAVRRQAREMDYACLRCKLDAADCECTGGPIADWRAD